MQANKYFFKVNTINKLRCFSNLTYSMIIFTVSVMVCEYIFKNTDYVFWWISIIFLIFFINFILVILLYIQYNNINKKAELKIDIYTQKICYSDLNTEFFSLLFSEIKTINIHRLLDIYTNYSPLYDFRYAEIITINNERIIITNLLIKDLEKFFIEIGLKYNRLPRWLFPSIKSIEFSNNLLDIYKSE